MELIAESVEPQLLPDVDDEIEGVVHLCRVEGVAELETVLLEGKQAELSPQERGVELVEIACEAALVRVAPNGSEGVDELHVVIMVADHAIQVFGLVMGSGKRAPNPVCPIVGSEYRAPNPVCPVPGVWMACPRFRADRHYPHVGLSALRAAHPYPMNDAPDASGAPLRRKGYG